MTSKRTLLVAGVVFLIAAGGILLWRSSGEHKDLSAAARRDVDLVFPVSGTTPGASSTTTPAEASGTTQRLANPLERATDLRSVYERFRKSGNPAERNAAYRAWTACYPTFVAPQDQPVTLDMVTRTLPQNAPNNAERVEAYRTLLGRCKAFFDLPRNDIMAETQRQKNAWQSGLARAEGERVLQRFRQGDAKGAVLEARDIIASGDAYAIYSLRDFMAGYLAEQRRASSGQETGQPDLRALAFYLVPCELGMECGPDSLTALQLCANNGECTGNVADRYTRSFAAQVDPETLRKEAQRVADAIRAHDFAALGL